MMDIDEINIENTESPIRLKNTKTPYISREAYIASLNSVLVSLNRYGMETPLASVHKHISK